MRKNCADIYRPGNMMMKTRALIALLPWFLLLGSCATPTGSETPTNAVQCIEPRPQVCTMDYTPVCAKRCANTSCESVEMRTFANACTACADPLVVYQQPGACES